MGKVRRHLIDTLEDASPVYKMAQTKYAELSRTLDSLDKNTIFNIVAFASDLIFKNGFEDGEDTVDWDMF